MKYNIVITERAEEMLNYIFNQLKNPQAAVNLIGEIEQVYSNMENNSKMYACSEDTFL